MAICFLQDTKQTFLDHLAEMHIQFMADMERKAAHAWEEEHRRLRKRLKLGVVTLRQWATHFLAWRQKDQSASLDELLRTMDDAEIQGAIDDCQGFEDLETHGLLRRLHAAHRNFRRYFPHFLSLKFASDHGGEAILKGIGTLRQLESGQQKTLPRPQ